MRQFFQFFGVLLRPRKRDNDSTSPESRDDLEIEVLYLRVLHDGAIGVDLKHASVTARGCYDAQSTENSNIVGRQWLSKTIGQAVPDGAKVEVIIFWKFKGVDCGYKSLHRVAADADSRVMEPVVLLFYHNRPSDIPATELSSFQQGVKAAGNLRRKRTLSWQKVRRHLAKHPDAGTGKEKSRDGDPWPSSPQPSFPNPDESFHSVNYISLPGVAEAEREHGPIADPGIPNEFDVVDSPLRPKDTAGQASEQASESGRVRTESSQPLVILDLLLRRGNPTEPVEGAQLKVSMRPPNHPEGNPGIHEDAASPLAIYSKDPRLRSGATLVVGSHVASRGDGAKYSSQHSGPMTGTSSPTSDARNTVQGAPPETDATSPYQSIIEGENPSPMTGEPTYAPVDEASGSQCYITPEVMRPSSQKRRSTDSSNNSNRPFPDNFWTWDAKEQNYYHWFEDEDGTSRQEWYPTEFM